MGGGGKGGGTTVQTTQIPPEVLARYNAVNARAEEVAKAPFQPYTGEFVAPLTSEQLTGIRNVMATQGMTEPYVGAGTGLTLAGARSVGPLTRGQIGYYESPYTQAVAAPTYAALRQQQGQELAQQQAQAIRSGAAFGERSGLERANLMRQQALGTAQALAPIYQQGYGQAVQTAMGQQGVIGQDLQRQMAAGQQIAGLGAGAQQAALQSAQAQIAAGTLPQQTQQALNTALYQQFLQERGYPFQVAQFLANIATGTGALSGSTTTQQQSGGFFGSDERLKKNMEPVGKLFDGQTIYRYEYKDDPEGKTRLGVSANEAAEQRKPGLGVSDDGYLMVNYRDVTEEAAERGRGLMPESMGGAVMSPGAYARGGYADGGMSMGDIIAAQRAMFPYLSGPQGQQKQPGLGIPTQGMKVEPLRAQPMLQRKETPDPLSVAGKAAQSVSSLNQLRKDVRDWWNEPKSKTAPASGQQLSEGQKAAPTGLAPTVGGGQQSSAAPWMGDAQGNVDVAYSGQAYPLPKQNVGLGVNQTPPMPQPVDRGGFDTSDMSNSDMSRLTDASQNYDISAPGDTLRSAMGVTEDAQNVASNLGEASEMLNSGGDLASAGDAFSSLMSIFAARGGKIEPKRKQYAGAGFVTPGYDPEQNPADIMDQVVDEGEQSAQQLLSQQKGLENKVSGGGGGGGGSGLGTAIGIASTAAKFLPMIFSDERMKKNMEQVGELFDGQPVFRYDINGETEIGLGAQHVLGRKKEAVAEAPNGLLMVDYKKATEDAVPFAYGGLVPRKPHQAGERVVLEDEDIKIPAPVTDEKPVPPADIPAKIEPTRDEAARVARQPEPVSGRYGTLGDYARAALPEKFPTSENIWVPALSFLGGMLSSPQPRLAGAIGTGLLAGVEGYSNLRKQQQEDLKIIFDMARNNYQMRPDPDNPDNMQFINKTTGTVSTPDQMQEGLALQMIRMGIDPVVHGIDPAIVARVKGRERTGGAPTVAEVAAGTTRQTVPSATQQPARTGTVQAQPKSERFAPDVSEQDLLGMNEQELRSYVTATPERRARFGLVGPDDPEKLDADIVRAERAMRTASVGGDPAAFAQAQSAYDKAIERKNSALKRATDLQLKKNLDYSGAGVKALTAYEEKIGDRAANFRSDENQLITLAEVLSRTNTGAPEQLKANLVQWLKELPGVTPDMVNLAQASSYEEALKLSMQRIYQIMDRQNLTRAPAATQTGLGRVVPGPQMVAGATKPLIASALAELQLARERDEAYYTGKDENGKPYFGMNPYRFELMWSKNNQDRLKELTAQYLNELPDPKGVTRKDKENWYATYGKYGYKPEGTAEPAKQEPVTSGTVNNVPFKVVP